MNILYCGNDVAYQGIELSVYTLLTHNTNCNIYIFTMEHVEIRYGDRITMFKGITDDQKSRLRGIVNYLDPSSNLVFIDCTDLYHEYFDDNLNEDSGFTPYATLRLLAHMVLPNIDNIWYLDCDTAILENFEDKYNQLAAKNDHTYYAWTFPWEQLKKDIINRRMMISGVLFMNLRKIRESNFFEKVRWCLYNKKCPHYDQNAIDYADDAGYLSERYSFSYPFEDYPYDPVIIHFCNQLPMKIYHVIDAKIFYRTYSFLQYVDDGLKMLEDMNMIPTMYRTIEVDYS